jgi:oligoribonuclease NrnB/cAMP/cGMP phosphodiesterase (DHH superfamily)
MNPLCIYHGNCQDGFGAAWVIRRFFREENVDFHFGVHSEAPPDVTGRQVIMVDFSYKRAVIDEMTKTAQSILILDHHKSAEKDLEGFPEPRRGDAGWIPENGIFALFNMERSGASLTWDYFFPNEHRPRIINHIEDRDLWRFKLEGTREISASLFSYPYDFEVWDHLMNGFTGSGTEVLFQEGKAIERKHHKDVAELVKTFQRTVTLDGQTVPFANIPYTYASDAGHLMSKNAPFAVCYWDTPTKRIFSLRSQEDGADVAAIAVKYGGGGHEHAAGFAAEIGWEGE